MKAIDNIPPVRKVTEKAENSNPNIFSPDTLRNYMGCEHYTDVEAKTIINSLEKLGAICYSMLHNSDTTYIDNQQVVYLNPHEETKLKAA
jgi:hypothetical protein